MESHPSSPAAFALGLSKNEDFFALFSGCSTCFRWRIPISGVMAAACRERMELGSVVDSLCVSVGAMGSDSSEDGTS